jgi:hypothetical protein
LSELAYDLRLSAQLDSAVVYELFSVVRHWIGKHSMAVQTSVGISFASPSNSSPPP